MSPHDRTQIEPVQIEWEQRIRNEEQCEAISPVCSKIFNANSFHSPFMNVAKFIWEFRPDKSHFVRAFEWYEEYSSGEWCGEDGLRWFILWCKNENEIRYYIGGIRASCTALCRLKAQTFSAFSMQDRAVFVHPLSVSRPLHGMAQHNYMQDAIFITHIH